MTRATDHYSVSAREIKYRARFFSAVDIAVREYRNAHRVFDRAYRFIFRVAGIKILSRAPMHGECLYSAGFRSFRDCHGIAFRPAPARAYLESDRNVYRAHDTRDDARDERFVA